MVDIGLVDIDDICVQCATALAASGDFATVEAVQRRALADVSERFAPTAAAAAITAIRMARALPSLMQLAEIQHRLETFTQAFVSSRGIATLHDLEHEATLLLHSLQIPVLRAARVTRSRARGAGTSATHRNPDEIELALEDDGAPVLSMATETPSDARPAVSAVSAPSRAPPASFAAFGVGPLAALPMIRALFRVPMVALPPRETATGGTRGAGHQCMPAWTVSGVEVAALL